MKKPSLPALKRQCWKLLSEYIRRSAANKDGQVWCYTCNECLQWRDAHAGHFVPGRTGSVLLNPEVIRVQCPTCNIWRSGNYHAYTLRMIDEVGRKKVEELLALKHKVVKWDRASLEEFRDRYKTLLKAL